MTSPFLTTREACELLRFTNKAGQVDASCLRRLYTFCTRYQVRTYSRGARTVLIHKDDLLAALQPRAIGPLGPTGDSATSPVRRFISPHGPVGDQSAGPIASSGATSPNAVSRDALTGSVPSRSRGSRSDMASTSETVRAGNSRRSA